MHEVTTDDELTALLGGGPTGPARTKVRDRLHAVDRAWLAASPLCLVATCGAGGSCDVSPKGDPPGFAVALDDRTVALPERPGNRRADSFRNVLANPHVGLIFLVPGRTDTLRINGRARVVTGAAGMADMEVAGHRPALALLVDVAEVFTHCQKAFLRSRLWDPASWDPGALPSRAAYVHAAEGAGRSLEELECRYGEGYADRVYCEEPPS